MSTLLPLFLLAKSTLVSPVAGQTTTTMPLVPYAQRIVGRYADAIRGMATDAAGNTWVVGAWGRVCVYVCG